MKLEQAASAAVSATASNTPAFESATISDEEYARRLYAELNGAVLKTRRSTKLSVPQAPASHTSNSSGLIDSDSAVQESQETVAIDGTEISEPEPTVPKEPAQVLVVPPKKLTGIHRELQRLLCDPMPIRSSKQKAGPTATPQPAAVATDAAARRARGPAEASAAAEPAVVQAAAASLPPCSSAAVPDATPSATLELQKQEQDQQLAMAPVHSPRTGARTSRPRPAKADAVDAAHAEAPSQQKADKQGALPSERASGSTDAARLQGDAGVQARHMRLHSSSHRPAALEGGGSARPGFEGTGSSLQPAQRGGAAEAASTRQAGVAAAAAGKNMTTAEQQVEALQHDSTQRQWVRRERPGSSRAAPADAAASPIGSRGQAAATARAKGAVAAPAMPVVRNRGLEAPAHEAVLQPPKASYKRRAEHAAAGARKQQQEAAAAPAGGPVAARSLAVQPQQQQREAPAVWEAKPLMKAPASVAVKLESGDRSAVATSRQQDAPLARPLSSRLAGRHTPAAPAVAATDSASASAPRALSPLPTSPPIAPGMQDVSSPAPQPAQPSRAARASPAALPTRPQPTRSRNAAHPVAAAIVPHRAAAPARSAAVATRAAKPRRIPKMPMVSDGSKWYRAKVVQQRSGRVLLEFMGLQQTPVPFWLEVGSDRIWTGSYKGKDWRYLGGGAWEPKKQAAGSRHVRNASRAAAGAATPATTATTTTTDKESNSSAAAAACFDDEQGENSSKQQAAPAEGQQQGPGRPQGAEADGQEQWLEQGCESEGGGEAPVGHVTRKVRSALAKGGVACAEQAAEAGRAHRSRQQQEKRQRQQHVAKEEVKQEQAAQPAASTPSSSSQEHAATWHELAAADDSHSEDGAVTMALSCKPLLTRIDTTTTHTHPPLAMLTASCSLEAGATPHAASLCASTQQDAPLSCVASCPPPSAAAGSCGAGKGAAEGATPRCVESVVTSCGEAPARAASAADAGGNTSRPSSPHEVVVPHRCRRKGKPMRSCIDNEDEPLTSFHASADTAPSSTHPTNRQESHSGSCSKQQLLLLTPLLCNTDATPTADDTPTPSSSTDKAHPTLFCPTDAARPAPQALLSGTFSSATIAQQSASSEPPPHLLFHPTSLNSCTQADASTTHSDPAAAVMSCEDEGAALLASLRNPLPGGTAADAAAAAAAAAAAKRRRRGNGWTKVMRPSRPPTHPAGIHSFAASMMEDSDAAATLSSFHDSSGLPHPNAQQHHVLPAPDARTQQHMQATSGGVKGGRNNALGYNSRPRSVSAPGTAASGAEGGMQLWEAVAAGAVPAAARRSTPLLLPSPSGGAAGSKRLWDAVESDSLASAAAAACAAGLLGSAQLPPLKRAAAQPGGEFGMGGVLPSSILACLRPHIPGVMSLPGLCRHEPLPMLMAFPPKPPMPLFKPL